MRSTVAHMLRIVSKQMKTINFSLSSPKYSTQGWVVRVNSGKHHQVIQQINHRKKKRRDRLSIQTTESFLLPTISFRNDISTAKVTRDIMDTVIYSTKFWQGKLHVKLPPQISYFTDAN